MWTALGTLLGGALMGGGSLVSGLIGANSSDAASQRAYDAQMETNALNYQMFKENQAWTERMANTAHQREVTDLREAGLNPILSAMGGSGAQTPQIATPVAMSPGSNIADKSAIYSGMVNSMLSSLTSAADVADKLTKLDDNLAKAEKTKSETTKNKSETEKTKADTSFTKAREDMVREQIKSEVGKQNPYQILTNMLSSAPTDALISPAFSLLRDAFSVMHSQFKLYKQENNYLQWKEKRERFNPESNTARPVKLTPQPYGYSYE